jgi:hypothetical protein
MSFNGLVRVVPVIIEIHYEVGLVPQVLALRTESITAVTETRVPDLPLERILEVERASWRIRGHRVRTE